MSTPFKTRQLPDLTGKRFGNLPLGYDIIVGVRQEHAQLAGVVALVARKQPEDLVVEDIVPAREALQNLQGLVTTMRSQGNTETHTSAQVADQIELAMGWKK